MSHGRAETDKLISNVQAQLNKLLTQLSDLDELRAELDDDEYEETRRETLTAMEARSFADFPGSRGGNAGCHASS
jgi:prefoldin subunit 5